MPFKVSPLMGLTGRTGAATWTGSAFGFTHPYKTYATTRLREDG